MMAGASTHRVSFILTRQAPVYTIKEDQSDLSSSTGLLMPVGHYHQLTGFNGSCWAGLHLRKANQVKARQVKARLDVSSF